MDRQGGRRSRPAGDARQAPCPPADDPGQGPAPGQLIDPGSGPQRVLGPGSGPQQVLGPGSGPQAALDRTPGRGSPPRASGSPPPASGFPPPASGFQQQPTPPQGFPAADDDEPVPPASIA